MKAMKLEGLRTLIMCLFIVFLGVGCWLICLWLRAESIESATELATSCVYAAAGMAAARGGAEAWRKKTDSGLQSSVTGS